MRNVVRRSYLKAETIGRMVNKYFSVSLRGSPVTCCAGETRRERENHLEKWHGAEKKCDFHACGCSSPLHYLRLPVFYMRLQESGTQMHLRGIKFNTIEKVINASAPVTLLEQRPEKNFRLWAGFEPTTSAMLVQCSPNWAIKATWEWSYMG